MALKGMSGNKAHLLGARVGTSMGIYMHNHCTW